LPIAHSQSKNAKETPSKRTTTDQMNGQTTYRQEGRTANITYTQAGVSCFVGQESDKFGVRFFVGSSVVKIPACV